MMKMAEGTHASDFHPFASSKVWHRNKGIRRKAICRAFVDNGKMKGTKYVKNYFINTYTNRDQNVERYRPIVRIRRKDGHRVK